MTKKIRKSFTLLQVFLLLIILPLLITNSIYAMPPVQRTILPNKLVLLVNEDHSLPMVTLQLLIDAGSRRDPAGQEGLAYLTSKGILLGTSKHTFTAINEEMDFMGGYLTASADNDFITVSFRVLKKDLDKGFNLFMETLMQPSFPEEEIKKEIQKTLAAIQSDEEMPEDVAEKAFQKTLFPDNPYGHPAEGTKESIPKISRKEIVKFYDTYYHPNISVLAVVGDISAEEVKTKLIPRFNEWQTGKIPEEHFNPVFAEEPKVVKINRDIAQANIIIGQKGVSRNNPDYYCLTVMNYIFGGGGFGSKLMDEIRVKRGLAYSVASFFSPGKYPGSFQINLQTKNSSAKEAISVSVKELEQMQEKLVSEQDLIRAKKYLTGSFPMRFDTQGKLANFITQIEYYGLGLDYPEKYPSFINSIKREDVLRVAKKYLHPKNLIISIVANLKETGEISLAK